MTELAMRGPGDGRVAEDSGEAAALEMLWEVVERALSDASEGCGGLTVDAAITAALEEYARQALRGGRAPLDAEAQARARRALHDGFAGSDGLRTLLNDPSVEEIIINGYDNVWVTRRDGTKARVGPVAESDAELEAVLRAQGAAAARRGGHRFRFDSAEPELSVRLANGARLHALIAVTDRIAASIRLPPPGRDTLADLARKGEMSEGMAALFAAMVRARRNIVVSARPAVGTTTLLRTLGDAIPGRRRVLLIDATGELRLDRRDHPDMTAVQTRTATMDGVAEFGAGRALRAGLQMRPDVVILGAVRGAEVVPMAKALAAGIDGSMCAVDASDSAQALLRLVDAAMEPPALYPRGRAVALIASAVHFVIHLDTTAQGARVVSSVREVVGNDGDQIISNEVYRPGPDNRAIPAVPLLSDTQDRMAAVGFYPALLSLERS